jgi:hypothetical protein
MSVSNAGFWNTMEYLRDADTQDQEDWPEILAVWCKSYSDMMSAHLTYTGVCGSAELKAREEENEHPLPDSLVSKDWRKNIRTAIVGLRTVDTMKRDQLTSCNDTALKFLRGIKPVAQNRGTFAVINKYREMCIATGRNMLQVNKFVRPYQHCHNMVLMPPRGKDNNKNTPYDVWTMDYHSKGFQHTGLKSGQLAFEQDGKEIYLGSNARERGEYKYNTEGLLFRFLDLTAVPVPGAAKQFTLYATINQEDGGAVEGWSYDANTGKFARSGFKQFYGLRLTQIRAVAEPVLVPGDPDRSSTAIDLLGTGPIIYAAVKDEPKIFVIAGNETIVRTIPIPMSVYSGVAVDSQYVWMYGPHGFACATHASVIRCLLGERPTPWWLGNGQPKNILGHWTSRPARTAPFWCRGRTSSRCPTTAWT